VNLAFYIAHQVEGRTRLRVTERLADPDILSDQVAGLEALPGVFTVKARPATGSLIIDHEGTAWADIAEQMEALDLAIVEAPQPAPTQGLQPLISMVNELDAGLRSSTSGSTDLRSMTVLLILVLALTQALRGNIFGPTTSFLWYALNIVFREGPDDAA